MNSMKALLIAVVGLSVWLAGCEVDRGTARPNEPPTTVISVAPNEGDTVNHYIALRWAGNDPDGYVAGYRLWVDEVLRTTTAHDTTIAFLAPDPDVPEHHTFQVAAVDNEGMVDPSPATREFWTINFAPTAVWKTDGSVPEGVNVGRGFRMTIEASDSNLSSLYYSVALDDSTALTRWVPDTAVFVFADPDVIADAALFPNDVIGMPNTGLTPGSHTIYGRVKDAGEAVSPIISRTVVVQDTMRPLMVVPVTASYGDADFYPDGSAYYVQETGRETTVRYSATAAAYYGEIEAYRYQLGDAGWSEWNALGEIVMTDVQPGEYTFQLMARDMANVYSDTDTFIVRIVEQTLSDSIIVVDETRDGNGNRGSPNDPQVDDFYARVLAGANILGTIDYATHVPMPEAPSYLSPYDVCHAGLILWHADDKTDLFLGDNVTLLRAFLDKGGRLILSGWNVMAAFGTVPQGDSVEYASGSFVREMLRAFRAVRNTPRTTIGYDGAAGYPTLRVDPEKVPASWNGQLDVCWAFQQRGECEVIGQLTVSDSLTNPIFHRTAAYIYDLRFRVAVFGVPLYFCYEDQVTQLMGVGTTDGLIPRMLAGLH
jgi:hypothetical protein